MRSAQPPVLGPLHTVPALPLVFTAGTPVLTSPRSGVRALLAATGAIAPRGAPPDVSES